MHFIFNQFEFVQWRCFVCAAQYKIGVNRRMRGVDFAIGIVWKWSANTLIWNVCHPREAAFNGLSFYILNLCGNYKKFDYAAIFVNIFRLVRSNFHVFRTMHFLMRAHTMLHKYCIIYLWTEIVTTCTLCPMYYIVAYSHNIGSLTVMRCAKRTYLQRVA